MSLVGYRNHCKYAPKRPLIAHEFLVKDEWQKGLPPSPTGNPASAFTLQNSTHSQNLVTFSGPPCPPFLALPLDVRLDIYHHAFRGRLVLVDRARKRHNQWHDCYQIHYHDEWYDEYADTFKWSAGLCNLSGNPAHDTDENGDGEWAGSRAPFPRINSCHCLNAPTWPLLCLCHQVYFEALPVFYPLSKFSFSSPRHFWNFHVRVDKNAPLLEDCEETQGWYNRSMEIEEAPNSRWARSKSPKPSSNLRRRYLPLKECRAT
jgi:hypothetical protein